MWNSIFRCCADSRDSEESSSPSLDQIEKDVIQKTLQGARGNKSLAAKRLGISRRTLYRKIEEYAI